ncbi:putative SOS response-associated peptidase YedK [Rhizobium sp. BK529]|uniref:SOS response-associated peptidase n=1 Tax=unclassified Rhizobium TaxID=2613769 RepID=UPI0010518506|nr:MULTISPECIES: SOS response-associated peptidase [unclassified Rhizobium]MBB3591875.1 putative SOS response-associated peptidase YedK [Rhizobium sp. BK529]TCS08241.1 putative SOS response-associated peptidase YedK [Rhizobium sp. BK418]
MCGRFALTSSNAAVQEFFSTLDIDAFPERYNIAPTQPILVVISGEGQEPGSNLPDRRALLVRWGFTPGWVKDPKEFPLLINARAETAIGKASFRAAMRHRRILIPASGFYEWHRPSKESGEKAQAYWIRPRRGGVIAFAGLMETWSSADGSEVDTGAILTTRANSAISSIHDRMPVVIQPEDFSRWLDCKTQEPREVIDLMQPVQDDFFEAIPVSDKVNKVANMGPDLHEPVPLEKPPKPPQKKTPPDGGQLSFF